MTVVTCKIEGCVKLSRQRGWCSMHYKRWRRHGDPMNHGNRIIGDDEVRFWSYVDKYGPVPADRPDLGSCWLWTGCIDQSGYALWSIGEGSARPYRWAYEHFIAPIPDGLQLDHLCRNRQCVNYESHLEPVTPSENVRRSPIHYSVVEAARTHCPAGHSYDSLNTITEQRDGYVIRACRECVNARRRRRWARNREAAK